MTIVVEKGETNQTNRKLFSNKSALVSQYMITGYLGKYQCHSIQQLHISRNLVIINHLWLSLSISLETKNKEVHIYVGLYIYLGLSSTDIF